MKKYTLITGASYGIGLELAKVFAKNGHNLILVARNEERLHKIQDYITNNYNVDVLIIAKDLKTLKACKQVYRFTKEKNIFVNVLVNNAGFGDYGEFINCSLNKQLEMINLNISAVVSLTHMFIKDMDINKEGYILNLASLASFVPGPLMSIYYSTKAFVLSFSESLAVELKDSNIYVTALCPGPTKSHFSKTANMKRKGFLKGYKPASASYVANYGYESLFKHNTVAVPGKINKTLSKATRFIPKNIVRNSVYLLQK